MEVAEIEALTREVLPALRETPLVRTVIERSGSSRRFVKLRPAEGAAGTGVVAMHYTLDRPENGRFGAITDFLRGLGVPVPAIRHRDEGRQVIWLEDLGTEDLAAHATDDWDTVRRPLYAAALRAVFPLHRVAETSPPPDLPALEKPFDAALYRWEQDYFFARFAPHFSALDAAACEAVRQSPELAALAESLGKAPRRLIHRDFQSSNVMLRAGAPVFIDYQGMRWGLAEYDLASLLFDPYVPIDASRREDLARDYFDLKRAAGDAESYEVFRERLDRCACQRLMQALGAYGYLGLEKGQREFLKFIPVAVERLREVAVGRGAAPSLAPVLCPRDSCVA